MPGASHPALSFQFGLPVSCGAVNRTRSVPARTHRARRVRLAVLPAPRVARESLPDAQTVLIVDDHSGFRASARELLECEGYDVVGEATTRLPPSSRRRS